MYRHIYIYDYIYIYILTFQTLFFVLLHASDYILNLIVVSKSPKRREISANICLARRCLAGRIGHQGAGGGLEAPRSWDHEGEIGIRWIWWKSEIWMFLEFWV